MKKFRAETIEDVILIMDEIVRNCRMRGSRVAYFTVLYRTTTHMVKKHCDEGGFFDDDDRMRRLDVAFANLYFDSFFADQHYSTRAPAESWKITFNASNDPDIVLIQHLLAGMNAHISLDLGVATAMIADGDLNESLKRDFLLLNEILTSLIHVVQTEISEVSSMMGILDRMAVSFDEFVIDQGIRFARNRAWDLAERLTLLPPDQRGALIRQHDKYVASINRRILYPGWWFRPAQWFIKRYEKSAPHEIISGLAGERWYESAHRKVLDVIGEIDDPFSDFMKRETHLMRAIRDTQESQRPL